MSYALILGIFIILYLAVTWKAGRTYPILYLFALTYFLQYILSSYLIYDQYNFKEFNFQMAVSKDLYFEYAIPALFFLFTGVFLFNRDFPIQDHLKRISPQQANLLGYILLITSYSFDVLPFFGINALNSIISFTQYLKYVAAFCFLFTNSKVNYVLSGLIYANLAFSVLVGGVFIDFIIWTTYLFFFISLRFRLSFLQRASFIFVALPVLFVIQSVKDEYRMATWKRDEEAGLSLFAEMARKKAQETQDDPFMYNEGVVNTVSRLNEGWHLSRTLRHVPNKQPFVDGEEMVNDVLSSLLPRVVFQDKKVVHSKEKFNKFTGHKLRGNTAMTIGLLGDFYVNFGTVGSFIMLFIFGAIVAKLLHYFLMRYVLADPINIVWVPFMLSYLIRADNDFYIFFNCLIKGMLIFLAINLIRRYWPAHTKFPLPKPTLP
jgi:hypothetical protein